MSEYFILDSLGIYNLRVEVNNEIVSTSKIYNDLNNSVFNLEYKKIFLNRRTNIEYKFKSGSSIKVACYDWTKKMKYDDHLRMSLLSSEFNKWAKTAHN